jgi:hypothetical protein
MPFPPGLGGKPPWVAADADFGNWFADLAGRLLNACDLVVAGGRYRLAEVEMYYHGRPHPDPFAHRDPLQLENARWYFHRTGGRYRGGSFKGLDLTLGDGTAHFGILVRSIAGPDGPRLIDGPSRVVDHLLARTGAKDVAALDAMIAGRGVWDAASPLAVVEAEGPRDAAVFRCPRVGLSLKRAQGVPDAPKFVGRPYRFLTEPRAITKGKVHLALALHRSGETAEAIHATTGVPRKAVGRYVAGFEAGKQAADFAGYTGKELGTGDLCKLLGTWAAKYGR